MYCHKDIIDTNKMEMLVGLYFGSAVANAFFIHGSFYDGASG